MEMDYAAALPHIEGIVWANALKNIPTEEMLETILEEFCTHADKEIKEVNDLYLKYTSDPDVDNILSYRIKLHSLKHSAALIGAEKLSEEARVLEFAARDIEAIFQETAAEEKNNQKYNEGSLEPDRPGVGNIAVLKKARDIIDDNTAAFCSHYSDMADKIAVAFNIKKDSAPARMDADTLIEVLDRLETAMDTFDIQTLNSLSEKLEESRFEDAVGRQISIINEAVLTLEADKIKNAVKAIKELL